MNGLTQSAPRTSRTATSPAYHYQPSMLWKRVFAMCYYSCQHQQQCFPIASHLVLVELPLLPLLPSAVASSSPLLVCNVVVSFFFFFSTISHTGQKAAKKKRRRPNEKSRSKQHKRYSKDILWRRVLHVDSDFLTWRTLHVCLSVAPLDRNLPKMRDIFISVSNPDIKT